MKVWIDQDLCTGDGLCEEIAPACRVHLFVQCPDLELHGAPACGYGHR
jgi:NAD-dependent dihydropyrimidine dehydrogenase PreA subunit